MNLVSQLDALDYSTCADGNIDIRKPLIWRNVAKGLHDMTILDINFLKNGSKFSTNILPVQSRQYLLSYKPSQPIGRASWSDLRKRKHRQ